MIAYVGETPCTKKRCSLAAFQYMVLAKFTSLPSCSVSMEDTLTSCHELLVHHCIQLNHAALRPKEKARHTCVGVII